MSEMFSGMRSMRDDRLTNVRRPGRCRKVSQARRRSKQVNDVLLPHQSERLDQLAFQMSMRGGSGRAMRNPELRQKLGISEGQAEKLGEKQREIERELRKKS